MTDALPPPPVPPDADLKDFPYMPIFRARLFGSTFHARATDAEWRAGVTLWLKSWEQVPAGSLPDDDVDLCRLAELGRDLKIWRRIREGAMRGWAKASDGRLYHPVVAEVVAEAWAKRAKATRRGKAGASKRWSPSNAPTIKTDGASIEQASPGDRSSNAQAMLGDSKGREGKGKEEKDSYPETERSTTSRATRLIEIFDRVRTEIFGPEQARAWPQSADAVHAQRALDAGWTEHAAELLFRDRMAKRREQGKPPPGGLAWFEKPFAEASPAARTAEDVSDADPRAKAFVAAGNAWLALDPEARRKTPRPTREAFGLPPASEAAP
jgi:hypothetical protein